MINDKATIICQCVGSVQGQEMMPRHSVQCMNISPRDKDIPSAQWHSCLTHSYQIIRHISPALPLEDTFIFLKEKKSHREVLETAIFQKPSTTQFSVWGQVPKSSKTEFKILQITHSSCLCNNFDEFSHYISAAFILSVSQWPVNLHIVNKKVKPYSS